MSPMAENCPHVNLYQDHLVGEWHCDDCGGSFGKEKPEQGEPEDG